MVTPDLVDEDEKENDSAPDEQAGARASGPGAETGRKPIKVTDKRRIDQGRRIATCTSSAGSVVSQAEEAGVRSCGRSSHVIDIQLPADGRLCSG